jgi:folylpolyglutamate synthase/dihydropteroate synthase
VAFRLLEAAKKGEPASWTSVAWPRASPPPAGRAAWNAIEGAPPLLLDGAHNRGGRAAPWPRSFVPGRPFVLLFGAMADKDLESMAELLFPLADGLV